MKEHSHCLVNIQLVLLHSNKSRVNLLNVRHEGVTCWRLTIIIDVHKSVFQTDGHAKYFANHLCFENAFNLQGKAAESGVKCRMSYKHVQDRK